MIPQSLIAWMWERTLDPSISGTVVERWGVAGAVLVACATFFVFVYLSMKKKIEGNDADAKTREQAMANRINSLETKMLDEVMEVVRASHQLMIETKTALAGNTEAMNRLCQKIDSNFKG